MENCTPNPAAIAAPASYHWTPPLQRAFLEHLATSGSVKNACAMVGMSPRAAYDLQHRPQGAAFRIGWAAAVLIARGRLADELLDRAIWGIEEVSAVGPRDEQGAHSITRRRHVPSLGLAMLARLDKMVETRAAAGEPLLAQIVAGDWAGFLALFDAADAIAPAPADTDADARSDADDSADGQGAALAFWLAGRDTRANPLAHLWKDTPAAREVALFSADAADAAAQAADASAAHAGPTPEEEAAAMSMWFCDVAEDWRTDFPPPAAFSGVEEGEFGERFYQRTLDAAEDAARQAALDADLAPVRVAGEAARRAYFALPAAAANDAAPAPSAPASAQRG